jgi:hypothetical protein
MRLLRLKALGFVPPMAAVSSAHTMHRPRSDALNAYDVR